MKKLKLTLDGMHCASCAANIEKALQSVKGVQSASVSLMTKKGFVEVKDSVKPADLEKAVAKTGYKILKIE
ncbi:MAG: heavy metal-associated domain-containing protein [archaeon]